MDALSHQDQSMNAALTIFIALQFSIVVYLLGRALLVRQDRRVNADRKALLENFSPNDVTGKTDTAQNEGSGRSSLIDYFLESRYGRWFNRMCLRAGIWNSPEIRQLVGRKFEIGIAGVILAVFLSQILTFPLWLLLLLPPLAFMTPDYSIYRKGIKRGEAIARSLPETIDLLNMTVSAGLGFQAGLDRIARNGNNPLSDEFRRVLAEVRFGDSRSHAFTMMAERINRPEIWNFTNAISQVEKLGIPITSALRDQAVTIRAERREKAREQAQKLPVKILAPIMIFLLPAVLTIVLAPAVLSMLKIF